MEQTITSFKDRRSAGRELAAAVRQKDYQDPVILALPRGGVPVAYEVAQALDAPLDLLMVKKIGAPGMPEFAIGAVVDSDEPHLVLNEDVVEQIAPHPDYIETEMQRQLTEMERRRLAYGISRETISLAGKTAIIIDDGIATGATVKAALIGVAHSHPKKVVLAVPVAPQASIKALESECDEIVCLQAPAHFGAVGNFYQDFTQTADEEIIELMAAMQDGR